MFDILASLEGLISEEAGRVLYGLAAKVPADQAIVEIGSYKGKSTAYLAAGAMSGGGANVYSIDPRGLAGNPGGRFGFDQESTVAAFEEQLLRVGVRGQVTAIVAFSTAAAKKWNPKLKIGLLFIDGSHTEKDVRADWVAWSRHLAPGAVVVFDDYNTARNPGVKKVVKSIDTCSWDFSTPPLAIGRPPHFDITIVTSCYNYGRYLKDWAQSIINQTLKPRAVVLVDNGSDDDASVTQMQIACGMLIDAGIDALWVAMENREDFGSARNRAVSLAATEWVMHFDADDQLMPHCLAMCAPLAADADVIALGYERSGDRAAGPANKIRVYSNTIGQQTLKSSAPASGVSPFRKSLWEKSPYRTDMTGGWDTALWIGFAHLNARFKATPKPGFWYRQHADSIFNMRRKNARHSAIVGSKLQSLRTRTNVAVTVIIPWADDQGPRRRALDWILAMYAKDHPSFQVLVSPSATTEWSKGKVVNAVLPAARGDVLIVADADCYIPPKAFDDAVQLVASGKAPWVVPHSTVLRLSEQSTEDLFVGRKAASQMGAKDCIRPPYLGYAGGGIFVVDRAAFSAFQYPEQFQGWGSEDESMAFVLDTLIGKYRRLPYNLVHLWHPPGARMKDPNYVHNREWWRVFKAAVGKPDAMWAALATSEKPLTNQAVKMVAIAGMIRNGTRLKPGDKFYASPEEARKELNRHTPTAVPVAVQRR